MAIDLAKNCDVFVLTMRSGENRFNRPFLDEISKALDEVENSSGAAALVTVGEEKFYSNGLDLDWIMGAGQAEGAKFVPDFLGFLGRMLGFTLPTVAAINGHAFAGGGMLSLAHDFRVMREDRGFFCLPEIDIRLPLAPGMLALIQSKLDAPTCRDLILTGRRAGGPDAVALRVVDEAAPAAEVLPRAIARAAALAGKDRPTYGALKRAMYAPAIELLREGRLP